MPPIVLLGPQRRAPTMAACLELLGVEGRLTLIAAGWQEREAEDVAQPELPSGCEAVELGLFARGRELRRDRARLAERRDERHDRLEKLQRIYRRRLDHALEALSDVERMGEDGDVVEQARVDALEDVRTLDDRHLRQVSDVWRRLSDSKRAPAALQRQRDELAEIVAGSAAVLVAGGHVGVLLDRLRLFDLGEALRRRPLIAWSAGAMALAERVVLFHDSPPWGAGNAEVMGPGLGLVEGLLPLPHARGRLRLHDRRRVARFARRFAPALCLGLDDGAMVAPHERGPRVRSVSLLRCDGEVAELGVDDWEEVEA